MDYYKVLGLHKAASKLEIKVAFKKLAFQFHPDKHSQSPKSVQDNATIRFKQVSEAYEVLMDDHKRAEYNHRWQSGAGGGGGGNHYSQYNYGRSGYGDKTRSGGFNGGGFRDRSRSGRFNGGGGFRYRSRSCRFNGGGGFGDICDVLIRILTGRL